MRIQWSQQSSEVKIKSSANSLTESVIQTSADTVSGPLCVHDLMANTNSTSAWEVNGYQRCQAKSLFLHFLEVFGINMKWGHFSFNNWIIVTVSKAFAVYWACLSLCKCNSFAQQQFSRTTQVTATRRIQLICSGYHFIILNNKHILLYSFCKNLTVLYSKTHFLK